jgi:hypothetical protein
MSSIFGRSVIVPLTNKSGSSVVAGDVVILDSANNTSFTTTTSAGITTPIGVAQEAIASNAVGRVLVEGYASLVNVNASVTRLHYGTTHTVAKQATDAGASRVSGTFCCFLSSGTTPDALVYPVDLAGAALTNPMSAVGDIIQGTTAGAPARLAAPLAGKVLTGAGTTTPLVYSYPPAYQFDYAEVTSNFTTTQTVEASADTIVTGAGVAYDGSTTIMIEFFSYGVHPDNAAAGRWIQVDLFDGSSAVGPFAFIRTPAAFDMDAAVLGRHKLTPSNATHTYSARGFVSAGTGTVRASAGGPCFIRQIKV